MMSIGLFVWVHEHSFGRFRGLTFVGLCGISVYAYVTWVAGGVWGTDDGRARGAFAASEAGVVAAAHGGGDGLRARVGGADEAPVRAYGVPPVPIGGSAPDVGLNGESARQDSYSILGADASGRRASDGVELPSAGGGGGGGVGGAPPVF